MMNLEFSLPPVPADAAGVEQQQAPRPEAGTVAQRAVATGLAGAGSPADLQQIFEDSSKYFQQRQQHLSFSVDETSGRMVVSVIDSTTAEVIRQIPNEEMLVISRRMRQLIEENSMLNNALLVEKSA